MFKRFEDTAVEAYMIIRKNANVIINLFSMVSLHFQASGNIIITLSLSLSLSPSLPCL